MLNEYLMVKILDEVQKFKTLSEVVEVIIMLKVKQGIDEC